MKKPKQFKPTRKKVKSFSLGKKKTGRAKGYGKEWEAYRIRFLHHNPRCYSCGRHKSDIRVDVDHVEAHKGNMKLFWKVDNLIPLCVECHSIVTGMFDKYEVPLVKEKLEWIAKKREYYGVNIVVKVVPLNKKELLLID